MIVDAMVKLERSWTGAPSTRANEPRMPSAPPPLRSPPRKMPAEQNSPGFLRRWQGRRRKLKEQGNAAATRRLGWLLKEVDRQRLKSRLRAQQSKADTGVCPGSAGGSSEPSD